MRLGNAALRALAAIAAAAIALCAVGCTATTALPATPVPSLPPDPPTGSALLKIATAFNHGYDTGDYGPVYAPWDARSQAIITRADYIQRHKDCPAGSHALSHTESVSPGGPQGAWLVHYQIGGEQLTDYWFCVRTTGGSSTWCSATPTRSGSTGCPRASTPLRSDVSTDCSRNRDRQRSELARRAGARS